jgi:threonine dehydrogenase-like Zn-dependent dehydrogenase
VPARGRVRIEVQRCGICGSDLHARHGIDQWADLAERGGYDRFARSPEPVVFGHEFTGVIAEHGPGTRRTTPTGTPVVALPIVRGERGIDPVGLSGARLDLRFVIAYTPLEFRDTLHMLAEGEVDPSPLVTGTVGLDGVDAAFAALADPAAHAKVLVDPHSDRVTPG